MALSYAKYTGTGTTTQFPITFPYIDASHIFVSVNGVDVAFTSDVINQVVTLASAPALSADIRVYRFTPRNKTYSDFSRGNALGQRNMNNSFLWQLYISQEIAEGSISPEFVMNQDLNMGGNKVTNMGTATDDKDAVTYKQLNDALINISAQGIIPIVGGRQVGVAGQSQYNTPATEAASPASFRISIDGLLQRPVTDYTTDTIGKVDFVGTVPVGAEIDVVFFEPNNINTDASNLLVTASGSNTPRSLKNRFADSVNVRDFGAVGDGITDDTAAIQAAIDYAFPKYGQYYNVNEEGSPVELVMHGDFKVAELDMSYRNDMFINQEGQLIYGGSAIDGTWIEMKASARTIWHRARLNGVGKVGIFIHQSGDGYSNGDPNSKDSLTGKGNVTGLEYHQLSITGQNNGSFNPLFSMTPYPSDTTKTFYYSVDDSSFYTPIFKTNSTEGFAVRVGSSEINFIHPVIATANGIELYPSASIAMFNPVFSMRGGTKGCLYAVTNADIGKIDLFGAYFEEGLNILKHEGGSVLARARHINIYGGVWAGNASSGRIIDIPSGVEGYVNIDGMRVQEIVGRRIYAPSCAVNIKGYSNSNTTSNQRSYGFEIEEVGSLNMDVSSDLGVFKGLYDNKTNTTLYVNGNRKAYAGEFVNLNDAILYAEATQCHTTTINIEADTTVDRKYHINGKIRLTGNGTATLKINNEIIVNEGGSLTVDTVPIIQNDSGITNLIQNDGGQIDINSITINQPNGTSMVEHRKGTTVCNNVSLVSGNLVNNTYAYSSGQIILRDNNITSANSVVLMGGGADVEILGTAIPTAGRWQQGTRVKNLTPTSGSFIGWVCTQSGLSGTWKGYGAIS